MPLFNHLFYWLLFGCHIQFGLIDSLTASRRCALIKSIITRSFSFTTSKSTKVQSFGACNTCPFCNFKYPPFKTGSSGELQHPLISIDMTASNAVALDALFDFVDFIIHLFEFG